MFRINSIVSLVFVLLSSCSTTFHTITYNERPVGTDSLSIHEGILSTRAQTINYKRDGGLIATITLSQPVMVAMAEHEEQWGFFQFPGIGISDDGTLIVSWQMKSDSHKTYGVSSDRQSTPMMSKDGGLTWIPQDKSYKINIKGYNVKMREGDELHVYTPKTKAISDYKSFPHVVAKEGNNSYFFMNDLPDELKGVYFRYQDKHSVKTIHAQLKDPELLRYAIDDDMPIVWWGDIKQMSDNTLIAGVYPCYYLDDNGKVLPRGVSFYKSVDTGQTWELTGKVPLLSSDEFVKFKGDNGFTEPTYEVLADSTFLCVMRTGSSSPMFKSYSYDRGSTWTEPVAFTPNGVMPKLLKLNNGVLVLTSGRPGIQIRFCFDKKGEKWTDPIDMIPFTNEDGTITRDVSCGYASIIEADDNSFYLVYSNFTTRNEEGEPRKSIWFRKISVKIK